MKKADIPQNVYLKSLFWIFIVDSCKFVKCPTGRFCVEDQNGLPHCIICSTDCSLAHKEPVCGNDKQTYDSGCHLRAEFCRTGNPIQIAYPGPCKGITSSYKKKYVVLHRSRLLPLGHNRIVPCLVVSNFFDFLHSAKSGSVNHFCEYMHHKHRICLPL